MSEVSIKHTIRIPSLTLNIDNLEKLKLILEKTGSSPSFRIETDTEELNFKDFKSFAEEKWPTNIKQFTFYTGYSGRNIRGNIYTNDILGLSDVTIGNSDRDWISARVDELKRFFNQHRNWHNIFQNIKYLIVQGIFLDALLIYWLISYFKERNWPGGVLAVLIPVILYATLYLYGDLLPRIFPSLVLEPEHPSFTTKLRTLLKYLIPLIFVGLLIQLIWSTIS